MTENACCRDARRALRLITRDHARLVAKVEKERAAAEGFEAAIVAAIVAWMEEDEAEFVNEEIVEALKRGEWRERPVRAARAKRAEK